MNGKDNDDVDGTVYANTNANISKIANVSKLLKNKTLDQLLKENKEEVEADDENHLWYHKKISREAAESILLEGLERGNVSNGLFLIRDSTVSANDYALSMVCGGKIFHYQIQQKCEGFYRIDDGPVVHGLDKLVIHYTASANGLPAKLTSFCKGSAPPNICRKFGPTNLLHRAVLEGKTEIVKKMLKNALCPDVNAKNKFGSLALHDAANKGCYDVVSALLDKGADVKLKDSNGHTALHRACVANEPQIVNLLMTKGQSNSSERCSQNGWVPLHEAACKGHIECVKALLENDATPFPRNDNQETPLDLAITYNRRDCIRHFDSFKLRELPTRKSDWFHPELDRQGTQQMFEVHGMREGLFLIRPSKKHYGWHVLSLCHSRAVFNYEIRNQDYRDRLVHYIDDGPFLLSLEHVVYHYSKQMDGLPSVLLSSLNSANKIVDMTIQRQASENVIKTPAYAPPHLPPRPTSAPDEYSTPNKVNRNPPGSPVAAPSEAPTPPSVPPPQQRKQNEEESVALIDIPAKQIKKGHEIGQGEYGSVLKGVYIIKKSSFSSEKRDVALKTFHEGSVENASGFLEEAKVMQSLNHSCILRLLGVCQGPPLMLVEEYVAMGSMLDYLLDHSDEIDIQKDLYLWAAQIAMGMKYLESKRLVHRDLAARNILLQSKDQIKISDFGLSRAVGNDSDYYKATHGGRWPIKWYAPESVNFGHFSHASDVWSYGVTLWEMFSFGEPPYGEMKGIEVVQFIEKGQRLESPEKCPRAVYSTMMRCWSTKPEDRPHFNQLASNFQEDPEYACIKDLIRKY